MIKEAILYATNICDLAKEDLNEQTENNGGREDTQLPDLNLSDNTRDKNGELICKRRDEPVVFVEPLPPPPLTCLQNQIPSSEIDSTNKQNVKNNSRRAASSQAKVRASSTGRKAAGAKRVEDQSQPRPRSQSAKKVRKNEKGETLLHIAAMNGNLDEVEELLKDPAVQINAQDFAGWTPLHEACNKGLFEIMKLLLENGAEINAFNHQNNTPLHEATLNKRFDCVRYLLENGADQTLRNDFGFLPKDYLRNKLEHKQMLELFDNEAASNSHQPITNTVDLNQSDLNMSLTYRESRRGKNNKSKKIMLFGTGMSDADKIKLSSLASQLNLNIAAEMSDNGLEESVENGNLIRENEFEAEGSNKTPYSNGPFKGRMNASCQYPKLFEDCNFFLHGEFKVFDKQDFVRLIELAGGKILKREPKLDRVNELAPTEVPHHLDTETSKDFACSHFILYDAAKLKETNQAFLKTVRPGWLFACIDNFKIIDPQTFK